MSDSEDSDLKEGADFVRHQTKIVYHNHHPYIHMEPPDVTYKRWTKIKPEVKKEVGHMMRISRFWWYILLKPQERENTSFWAISMGFLDPNVSSGDLSLETLKKIEVLESILEAMDMGLSHREAEKKARALVAINMSLIVNVHSLKDAVDWLVDSGMPNIREKLQELDSLDIRYHTLRIIFSEYVHYLLVMSSSIKQAMKDFSTDPDLWSLGKSEEMKNKGNEQFQRKKYDSALKWYTKAIKYHPNNHILYGNRALCFIRSEKYLKAVGDGKRAVILQPDWAKGHYRFCDALFYLGEHQKALEANRHAQNACGRDPEGYKDLVQQFERFQTELQEKKAEMKSKKMETKKARAHVTSDSSSQPLKSSHISEPASDSTVQDNLQQSEKQQQHLPESLENSEAPAEDKSEAHKDLNSEMTPRKSKKSYLNTPEKPAVRSKHPPTPEKPAVRSKHPPAPEKPAVRSKHPPAPERAVVPEPQETVSDVTMKERFCAAVQEGQEALNDQRCQNAQHAFSLAVSMLDSSVIKDLGLSELDICVLLYGYATALLEIGQPEELAKARRLFIELESSERKFQSLVQYGMGRVYLKENRFAKALEHFSNALLIIQRNITPGKLTWPTTKAILEETQPACLQEHLENFIEMCKFPPKPDAVCRHSHCLSHSIEIYFSDPDFKGFVQLICSQGCKVEFHMTCWKKLKTLSFTDKNDKDFLKDSCFTPDCGGQICHIVIFGSSGLIKCEFETSIPKLRPAGRLRSRQQCTSIKKMKSKNDKKLRRKQHRLTACAAPRERNEVIPADDPAKRVTPERSVIVDRVLHQIHENKELFKEESVNISCVLDHLRPWLDLYECKGHESALKVYGEDIRLSELVDLLLESSNRVWARLFIEKLCSWLHIKPKLQQWAQQLDNAGLKAAESLISRYASHLQQLDVKPLLTFKPLQDAFIRTFGTSADLFDSSGFTLMEYLKRAPAKDTRLFIWTLEASRERYESCHFILDQYFEDDAVCLVIKKTDDAENTNSVFKTKSRHRKKKQKDSKSVILLSGMRGGHSRDEDDEDDLFSEENAFVFFNSEDPFSVPDHLRGQLAEFEEQYAGSAHRSYYKTILDNNPDPTKESLYDYFAQILEEHGPLQASDPLMVGELENFPLEAQQKITAAGGLEAFLLESLRFVMTNNKMGLMKHVVPLTESMSHLNPSAKEFWPHTDVLPNGVSLFNLSSFDNGASPSFPLSVTSDSVVLPDPYAFENPLVDDKFSAADVTLDPAAQAEASQLYETVGENVPAEYSSCVFENSVYISERSAGERGGGNGSTQKIAVSVQASDESKDVSISTEPLVSFERNNGDMIQKEKQTLSLSKKLLQMKEDADAVQQMRSKQMTSLQEELEEITHRTQIAGAELGMFQQKLEDEVKKDQQEKKENQETLKMLKMNIKELTDQRESFTRDISEKTKEYQTKLEDFLDVSNQCAAERMSLEDEIKRHRDTCVKDQKRSLMAQLSVLQNRRDHGLRCLRGRLDEGNMIVKHLTEASHSFFSAMLLSALDDWKKFISDIEEKIHNAEMEFESQMNEVKKGTRLCSLPPVSVPSPPAVPATAPAAFQQSGSHNTHLHSHHGSLQPTRTPTPTGRNTPQPAERRPEESQQHVTVYDRMLERLNVMFPHYNKMVLSKFIQEVRLANGGTLNALTYDDVVNRVAQLILDHQENVREMTVRDERDSAQGSTLSDDLGRWTGAPPLTHVWKNMSEKHRNAALALNMEDPCIICHEDMSAEDVCVLECRHSFHRQCIKSWLKEQSTCPTCREHALLPEDFPVLPGRHRKSQASAATFN
ncbi:E3 ubiquitin-protein ligase TTC3 isoform X1 [Paramisgurnus dabryanus]|uniref:E3 ubiquitin-protein ligase TTC3 isoform X1 n=1 Tax=Paramisgurnus dabryanus TaxID=90735 RepID=UPI0031F411C7